MLEELSELAQAGIAVARFERTESQIHLFPVCDSPLTPIRRDFGICAAIVEVQEALFIIGWLVHIAEPQILVTLDYSTVSIGLPLF